MNVSEIITNKIIEKLESGIIPWQRPWKANKDMNNMFPCYSYSTGKRYDLINQMLLDFIPGDYITFDQCTKAGGKVKKGAESKIVVGWVVTKDKMKDKDGNIVTDEEGNELEKTHFGLRYYRVFNITDCTGLDPKHDFSVDETDETETIPADEKAEKIIQDYLNKELTLTFENRKGNRAYYSPLEDLVVIPDMSQFEQVAEYYSTCFHELTHSTMKSSRCNREQDRKGKSVAFGSNEYSKEELVAEIGAATLVNIAGLETESSFRNSAAYVQSWVKALKNDTNMIIQASIKADKAIKYILGEE